MLLFSVFTPLSTSADVGSLCALYSTVISGALLCWLSSSLPLATCPFCPLLPGKPVPLSGRGPLGCLSGPPGARDPCERSSKFVLKDLCPPIVPGFSALSQDGPPRRPRGLPPKAEVPPRERFPRPLMMFVFSPRSARDDVGVISVGVLDCALSLPKSWRLAMLLRRAAGKLAVEGTGDGVYERRSATDRAARRLLPGPRVEEVSKPDER